MSIGKKKRVARAVERMGESEPNEAFVREVRRRMSEARKLLRAECSAHPHIQNSP